MLIPILISCLFGLSHGLWRFQAANYKKHFIRHKDFKVFLAKEPDITDDQYIQFDADTQFLPSQALNNRPGFISLQVANVDGYYLRHKNFQATIEKNDDSKLFKDCASWRLTRALDGKSYEKGNFYSLESSNFPGHYLRHKDFKILMQKPPKMMNFREKKQYKLGLFVHVFVITNSMYDY